MIAILFSYLLWFGIGAGLAYGILIFQDWTVRIISPARIKLSQWLVVGGAVIRWVFIFLIFMLALSMSVLSLVIVFISFLMTRLLILFMWNQTKFIEKNCSKG